MSNKDKKPTVKLRGMSSIAAVIERQRQLHAAEEASMLASMNKLSSKVANATKPDELASASTAKPDTPPVTVLNFDTFLEDLNKYVTAKDYASAIVCLRRTLTHPKFPYAMRGAAFPLVNSIAARIDVSGVYSTKAVSKNVAAKIKELDKEIAELLSDYSSVIMQRKEEYRITSTHISDTNSIEFPAVVSEKTVVHNVPMLVLTAKPVPAPYPKTVDRITGNVFIVRASLVGIPFFDPALALSADPVGKKGGKGRAKKAAPKAKKEAKPVSEHRKAEVYAAKLKLDAPSDKRVFRPESDGVWFACLPECFHTAGVERLTSPERVVASDSGVSRQGLEAAMRKQAKDRQRALRLAFEAEHAEDFAALRKAIVDRAGVDDRSRELSSQFKDMVGLLPTCSDARLKALTNRRLRDSLLGEKNVGERIRIRLAWQQAFDEAASVKKAYVTLRLTSKELKHKIESLNRKLEDAKTEMRNAPRSFEVKKSDDLVAV